MVTFHGPTASTPAARQMRMRGIEPHVQVVTENFLTVPGLVAGSDRDRAAAAAAGRPAPAERRDPGAAAPGRGGHRWSRRCGGTRVFDDDPEHAYLRDLVVRAAGWRSDAPDAGIDLVDAPRQKK